MEEVKRTLAGVRKDLGYTQKEMAEKVGINSMTYARYEQGKTSIPFKVAIKIADLAGIRDPRDIKFH